MSEWVTVCDERDLIPGTGVCALLGREQVAIFKTRKTPAVYAVSNYDPIGRANVLSRGIVGSIGDAIVVASPLYKQHFDLATGQCLEEDEHSVKTYPVRVDAGQVQLQATLTACTTSAVL
ncbi:MAG: nitrite reductase small subunit NirD [Cellvibrionaceae bacterium]|nr:nitrite reductase small subunit NirD [Cellvibrionaceae bacterium]